MHACGHDNHMAILLGTATALARMKDRLPGTVKVIFQPAEEGPPPGETGGAEQMVKENVLENPKVDAVFGLHVFPFPRRRDRVSPGTADGERRLVRDQGEGPADARRHSLGRHRSDRRRIADRDGPADDHQPHGEHHRSAGGRDGRPLHRRQSLEHHPGRDRARRHHSRVRRERAQGHPAPRRSHRDEHRRERRRDGDADVHAGLSGDAQRRGADRAHAADACGAWPAPTTCGSVR